MPRCACICTCTQCVGDGASRPLTHLREVACGACPSRFVGQEPSPCAVMVSATERDVTAGSGCTCTTAALGDASPVGSATRAEGSGAFDIHPERRADYGTAGGGSDGPAGNREALGAGGCACGSVVSIDSFRHAQCAASAEGEDASTGAGRSGALASTGRASARHALLEGVVGLRGSGCPSRAARNVTAGVQGRHAPARGAAYYAAHACHYWGTKSPAIEQGLCIYAQVNCVTGALPVYYMRQRPLGRMRIARAAFKRRHGRAFDCTTGRS